MLKENNYLCTRNRERCKDKMTFGALVQLVRIPACHAGGHGFESRTHRLNDYKALRFKHFRAFLFSAILRNMAEYSRNSLKKLHNHG